MSECLLTLISVSALYAHELAAAAETPDPGRQHQQRPQQGLLASHDRVRELHQAVCAVARVDRIPRAHHGQEGWHSGTTC